MVLSMIRWKGNVAIVTGASSGIGSAIVKQLVEEGLVVVGLARRVEQMKELAKELAGRKGSLHPIQCDITKEQDILNAFRYVEQNLGPVHILINNAGVLHKTSLLDGDTDKWKNIVEVNVIGLSIATREAARQMKANNIDGHIVHVNSIAGHNVFSALPLHMYSASKHGVTALADSLRLELDAIGSKIKISSVSPGIVKTELFDKSEVAMDFSSVPYLKPEDIADAVMYILSTPQHVQITELTIRPVNETL